MIWKLYKNKIYGFGSETHSETLMELDTSGYSFYREVIRGHSGIAVFGAHIRKTSKSELYEINKYGITWSEERIKHRLRYSNSQGGKMFDSFFDRLDYSFKKLIFSINEKFNIR